MGSGAFWQQKKGMPEKQCIPRTKEFEIGQEQEQPRIGMDNIGSMG